MPSTAGPTQRWARFRRLVRYYLDCIREERQDGVRIQPAAPPQHVPLLLEKELGVYGPSYRHTQTLGPAHVQFFTRLQLQGGSSRLFYGYPVIADVGPESYVPVFLHPADHELDGNQLAVRAVHEAPVLNPEALGLLGANDGPEAERALLERLGLVEEGAAEVARVADLAVRLVHPDLELEVLEPLRPEALAPVHGGHPHRRGLLNRAFVFAVHPSPYTRGLEQDLEEILLVDDATLDRTALAQLFADWDAADFPVPALATTAFGVDAILELGSPNAEQRAACRAALAEPLTVVTGPPGTGKSQVVVNMVANAFVRGTPVVFSSRNNKAVDVVGERLATLAQAPILLRLGSGQDLRDGLAAALTHLLAFGGAGAGAPGGATRWRSLLERARSRRDQAEAALERLSSLRTEVAERDAECAEANRVLGAEGSSALRGAVTPPDLGRPAEGVAALEYQATPVTGLARVLQAIRRRFDLAKARRALEPALRMPHLVGVQPTPALARDSVAEWLSFARRVVAIEAVLPARCRMEKALEELRAVGDLDVLGEALDAAVEEVQRASAALLLEYRGELGAKLDPVARERAGELMAIAQAIAEGDGNPALRKALRALIGQVGHFLPAWAVTNLSARGALPFTAGLFDTVVIDEASQSDIPSAIPLLFRARRATIIGDPQQLRHIATLPPARDRSLAQRHGLTTPADLRFSFCTSTLYDVAATSRRARVRSLLDHYRSHEDIVGFSNIQWYDRRLRVLTVAGGLRAPAGDEPGIRWTDLVGPIERPTGGGARSVGEAQRVVQEVAAVLAAPGFEGTVGVVTPFRAQANLMQRLLQDRLDPDLIRRRGLIATTAHGFQGDERDVVFFSPCVGPDLPAGARHFLASTANLFNVAVTRARGQLHVVGNLDACSTVGVPHIIAFARYFRDLRAASRPDPAVGPDEQQLEDALRRAGLKPMPQYAVGPYRLDLAILDGPVPIDVEIDGARYHLERDGTRIGSDLARDAYLRARGWKVKRFWAVEVRDRVDECVRRVREFLARRN